MALKSFVSLIIYFLIPVSCLSVPSVSISSFEKFSAPNSTWESVCSVVFNHVLHINVIVMSQAETDGMNIMFKHIQQVRLKSVTHWNLDRFPVNKTGNMVYDFISQGSSRRSGFLILLDDNKAGRQRMREFQPLWNKMNDLIPPNTPVVFLIFSDKRLKHCRDASNVYGLDLAMLLYYRAFIMFDSCADRVFFFDVYDEPAMYYFTRNNISLVHNVKRRLTMNMRGRTFRVAMANFHPAAVFKNGTNIAEMEGVDAFMLQTMAKYFNFTPEIILPGDGLPFGVYVNGTGSGTIKSVVERKADASLIGRFVMDYGTEDFDYTIPYQFDTLCVIVPKNPPYSMFKMFFMCFHPIVWLCISVVHLISAAVWFKIKPFWVTSPSYGFIPAYFDVYFLCVSGILKSSALQALSGRFFATTLYFFNIVLIGTLQGMIYKFTTSPIQYQMHTLEELDASGLLIETVYEDLVNTFPHNSQQEVIQSLGTKVRLVEKEAIWTWKPGDARVAALLRKNPSALEISMSANPNIVLVDECPRNFFLSYITTKNHKILPFFNQLIYRCFESGLLNKWLDKTYTLTNQTYRSTRKCPTQTMYSVDASLEYIAGAIFILGSGLLASLGLFLGEMYVSLMRKRVQGTSL